MVRCNKSTLVGTHKENTVIGEVDLVLDQKRLQRIPQVLGDADNLVTN